MAHRPDGLDMGILALADQGDEAGDLLGLDMRFQYLAQSAQPRFG